MDEENKEGEVKQATPNQLKEAIDLVQKTADKFGVESAQFKEVTDKVERDLEAQEKKNQEITGQLAEEVKKNLELKERMDDLELELAKKQIAHTTSMKELKEYQILEKYCKFGDNSLAEGAPTVEEMKTLRMDAGTTGGYLTTTEFDNMIIRQITEISPVRQIARVKTVSKKTLEIPTRTGIPTARYEGEAAEGPLSESSYGSESLTAYRLTTTVPFTMDLLMDSEFSLEAEINADVSEEFARAEGRAFVLGTGAKQPEGFLSNATLTASGTPRQSENAGTITGDDVLLITGDLKVGYNPMFAFNRRTLAFLRTLKGSDGHYLWQMNLEPGAPNMLAGDPYMRLEDMPDIGTNAYALVYADFARGYCITDRTGMSIIRDEITRKRNAIIELTFHRWNTGQVILPEAFKLLQIQ